MARETTIRLVDPERPVDPLRPSVIDLTPNQPTPQLKDGVSTSEQADGSLTVDFDPNIAAKPTEGGDFYGNIVNDISADGLTRIASDLLEGIQYDIDSRKDWIETRKKGMKLLGLVIEEPRGDVGTTSAPLEGMSTIRHPLLLEATVRFQATARAELLPAAGPVKVRNDAPPTPTPPVQLGAPQPGIQAMGANGGPPLEQLDELGNALETDMNHYLTVTATEYVPDTDRMLFYIGFGGDGFKKVYNCPLRRRPVSESVDAEDIIISDATTDLRNCGRVTHRIKMRPSVLKRMQIGGWYRDVPLNQPNPEPPNAAQKEKAKIAGQKPPLRPEDLDYTVYECYCELDIPEFAPKQFKGKALPLPYVVTLERDSRQVLAVRRNWNQEDEQCLAKQFFVQFPFIRGLTFSGLGLVHILGNVTMTLTAAWREMLDNGMFANFPGFLFAKGAGRQNSNQFRVPPGGGSPIDIPPGLSIKDAIMPLPYKETGAAHQQFIGHVEEVGQRLGQTADINVGEGKQDVPVGTTMALIEQATKIMDSVHKRLHAAQAEEFGLLKERFKEDPEAFWRHNKKPSRQWTVDQFKEALEQRELVPVADPNNPTSLHRIAKAVAVLTLMQQYPQSHDVTAGLKRIYKIVGIDAQGILLDKPLPPPPDPRFAAIQAKAQAQAALAQIQQFQAFLKAKQMEVDAQGKAADRASRERIEQMQVQLEAMRVQQEAIIHAHDIQRDNAQAQQDIAAQHAQTISDIRADQLKSASDLIAGQAEHHASMVRDQQAHEQKLAHGQEAHEQKMAQIRATSASS